MDATVMIRRDYTTTGKWFVYMDGERARLTTETMCDVIHTAILDGGDKIKIFWHGRFSPEPRQIWPISEA